MISGEVHLFCTHRVDSGSSACQSFSLNPHARVFLRLQKFLKIIQIFDVMLSFGKYIAKEIMARMSRFFFPSRTNATINGKGQAIQDKVALLQHQFLFRGLLCSHTLRQDLWGVCVQNFHIKSGIYIRGNGIPLISAGVGGSLA